MAYVADCDILVNKFECHSHYYIHFRANTFEEIINLLIHSKCGLDSAITLVYKDNFGIKEPTKVDTPLNKET